MPRSTVKAIASALSFQILNPNFKFVFPLGLPAFVLQPSLQQFSCGVVHHGNLPIACVKIASYNQHCSAPFFPALVVYSYQVYSGEGADNVIQSAAAGQHSPYFQNSADLPINREESWISRHKPTSQD
jgi:hypothetical protein